MKRIIIFVTTLLIFLSNLASCSLKREGLFLKDDDKAQLNVGVLDVPSSEKDTEENKGGINDFWRPGGVPSSTSSEPIITEEAPLITAEDLTGYWITVYRAYGTLHTSHYSFKEDQSFTDGGVEYVYITAENMEYNGQEGWQVAPMGHPYSGGNYSLDGNVATLNYTYDTLEGQWESGYSQTLEIAEIRDGKMILEDGTTYLRDDGGETDVVALCIALGVDYSTSESFPT